MFQNQTDFQKGWGQNIYISKKSTQIKNLKESTIAVFYSDIMDSGQKENVWHRAILEMTIFKNTSIDITFYSSETLFMEYNEEMILIDDFIHSDLIELEEKERILGFYEKKQVTNFEDILLYDIKGRYLWFKIDFIGNRSETPLLKKLKIYVTKDTIIKYLPEIYQTQENDFTERFLSIFQTLYDDMDNKITNVSQNFDIDLVDGDFLRWLSSWTAIEDNYLWTDEKLKYLMKNAIRLYSIKGTRNCISEMVELYTNETPFIIECWQTEKDYNNEKLRTIYKELYGDNPYEFTVIVSNKSIRTNEEYKTLIKIIDNIKPAHMKANVVVLKNNILLNKYSYLGVNSILEPHDKAILGEVSAFAFSVIGNDNIDRSDYIE